MVVACSKDLLLPGYHLEGAGKLMLMLSESQELGELVCPVLDF